MLQIDNLSVGFPDTQGKIIPVITGLSFSIKPNQIVGVVGESGSGKSLTALSIMGLLTHIGAHKISGSVSFEGVNIDSLGQRELSSLRGGKISMIFQDPFASFNPLVSIGKHMDETLVKHLSLSKKERRSKILELLKLVALPHPHKILKSFPHELSGGMLQRVMIAMAISCDPALLIADEITTALDVTIQKKIIHLLRNIKDRLKLSILFISHDLAVVGNISDHIIVMYCGNIVESGPTKIVLSSPQHPYTRGLIAAQPENNLGAKTLTVIPGNIPLADERPRGCPFEPRCSLVIPRCKQESPQFIKINKSHYSKCFLSKPNNET